MLNRVNNHEGIKPIEKHITKGRYRNVPLKEGVKIQVHAYDATKKEAKWYGLATDIQAAFPGAWPKMYKEKVLDTDYKMITVKEAE